MASKAEDICYLINAYFELYCCWYLSEKDGSVAKGSRIRVFVARQLKAGELIKL